MKHSLVIGFVVLLVLGGMAGLGWMILSDGGPGGSRPVVEEAEASSEPDPERPDLARGGADRLEPSRVQKEAVEGGDPLATAASRADRGSIEFITGRVMDESGRPVADAAVSVGTNLGFGGFQQVLVAAGLVDPREVQTVTTDPEGMFRLEGVSKDDNLQLRVDHPEYVTVTRQRMYLPSAGYDAGVVILEKGAAVSGLVYGPDSRPLPGAEVSWHSNRGRGGGGRGGFGGMGAQILGEAVRITTTDEKGNYRLAGLPPDPGQVRATHEGLAEATSEVETAKGQEARGVALTLGPGVALRGRVLDTTELPVRQARVSWRRSGFARGRNIEPEGQVETDRDGAFETPGLTVAPYDVTVEAQGFSVTVVENVRPDEPEPLLIVLLPTGSLRCAVRDELSGEAVTDAVFRLQQDGRGGPGGFLAGRGDLPADQVVDGGGGAYEIQGVAAGGWRLNVQAPDHSPTRSDVVQVPAGGASEVLEIRMMPAASVAGVVLDAVEGSPVARARVRLRRSQDSGDGGNGPGGRGGFGGRGDQGGRGGFGGMADVGGRGGFGAILGLGGGDDEAGTDAEGRFLIEGVAPGPYVVEVEHPDFAASRTTEVVLEPKQHLEDLEIRLVVGGSVEGVSVALDGMPAVGDTVVIRTQVAEGSEERPATVGRATTDARGYYLVEHLEPGAYEARLEQRRDGDGGGFRGGRPRANEESDKPFTIKDQEVVRVDFAQVEQPFLQGQVRTRLGPVADAEVRLTGPRDQGGGRGGRGGFFTATTDARGYYRITDLVAGQYTAEVRHPDSVMPLSEDVVVEDGYGAMRDFLLPGGAVSGRIRSATGGPLGDAVVRLEIASPSELPKTPDAAAVTGGQVGVPELVTPAAPEGRPGRGDRGGRGGDRFRGGFGGNSGQGVRTRPDGSFTIEWVPEGVYRVVASHAQFMRARGEAFRLAGSDHVTGQDLTMGEAGTLVVLAKDPATGRTAPQVMIQLQQEGGEAREMRMTDANGEARFEGIAPGDWTVSVREGFGGRGGFGRGGGDAGDAAQTGGVPTRVIAGRESRLEVFTGS